MINTHTGVNLGKIIPTTAIHKDLDIIQRSDGELLNFMSIAEFTADSTSWEIEVFGSTYDLDDGWSYVEEYTTYSSTTEYNLTDDNVPKVIGTNGNISTINLVRLKSDDYFTERYELIISTTQNDTANSNGDSHRIIINRNLEEESNVIQIVTGKYYDYTSGEVTSANYGKIDFTPVSTLAKFTSGKTSSTTGSDVFGIYITPNHVLQFSLDTVEGVKVTNMRFGRSNLTNYFGTYTKVNSHPIDSSDILKQNYYSYQSVLPVLGVEDELGHAINVIEGQIAEIPDQIAEAVAVATNSLGQMYVSR